MTTLRAFKLLEFKVMDLEKQDDEDDEDYEYETTKKDKKQFMIQMYGIDEKGKSASIIIDNFKPFFYVKVGNDWEESKVEALIMLIKTKMGTYYEDSLVSYKLIGGKQTLYGFDNAKDHKFVILKFKNYSAHLINDKKRLILSINQKLKLGSNI